MAKRSHWFGKNRGFLALGTLVVVAGCAISWWTLPPSELAAGSEGAMRRPTGGPQLVSVQRLPELDGQMCEWAPASAEIGFTEMLQEQQAFARPAGDAPKPTPGEVAAVQNRRPLRMIRDSFPSYSSVAVDIKNDRLENTPPTAKMSEPKRMIGGLSTWVEFQCALYIDQNTGDIYAVNNDTVDRLVVFSREQRGNVPPKRIIRTPHTTYGIAVDEPHQELFLTTQEGAAVSVFHKMAGEHDAPIRLLQGDKTLLAHTASRWTPRAICCL